MELERIIGYILIFILFFLLLEKTFDKKKILTNTIRWFFSLLKLLTNPKMLLTFGIAWMITNGWSYVFVVVGLNLDIKWMLDIGLGYQAFLWLPISEEKIITIAIAIILAKIMFHKDKDLKAKLSNISPKNIIK